MCALSEFMVALADVKNFQRPGHNKIAYTFIVSPVVSVDIHRLMRFVKFGKKGTDLVVMFGRVHIMQLEYNLAEQLED